MTTLKLETIGGEWGRDTQTGKVEFYRTGFPSDKIEKFDEEFYLPDSEKYPLAANGKYVRLNPNGDLSGAPEFKDKPKPENVSNFDWQGFEWTDAAQVPAEYIKGEGKASFENADLANNQLNALKRFVVDNNLVSGTWDEAKFQDVFGGKAGGAIKLELEKVGEANGKTVFSVKMNEQSTTAFRSALAEYCAAVEKDAQGGADGRAETVRMQTDIPGAAYEVGRRVVDGAINIVPDTLNAPLFPNFSSRTGTEPNFARGKLGNYDELAAQPHNNNGKPPIPRFETDTLKYEFESEMMRRGIFTGKVDDGIKTGDAITTAASIAAPIAVGKALTAAEPLQNLSLPKTTVIQIQSERQAASLLTQARKSEPTITTDLAQAAKQNGGEMVGLDYRLKTQESLARKIEDETVKEANLLVKEGANRGNALRTELPKQVGKINDAVRYTTTFSEQGYKTGIEKTLSALEQQGYKVVKFKDSWGLRGSGSDRGYRGVNVTLRDANGQQFELQFHTEHSFDTKMQTHGLYDEIRDPKTTPARKKELEQLQLVEGNKIKLPVAVDEIPNMLDEFVKRGKAKQ